ncbi:MAG: HDOD domain-containing protein [bacterium]
MTATVSSHPPRSAATPIEVRSSIEVDREQRRIEALLKTLRRQVSEDIREDRIEAPLLPSVAVELMRLTATSEFQLRDVVSVIERDQFITAKVLKTANSAFFAGTREVASLREAVQRLGVVNVRDIVLAISFRSAILRDQRYKAAMTRLWEHALLCGNITRQVAKMKRLPMDEAFLAGLLHDIGKPTLVISLMNIERVLRDRAGIQFEPGDYFEVVFDEFHEKVGALVASSWKLPSTCRRAIEYHHRPQDDDEHSLLVAAVHLADRLCYALEAEADGTASTATFFEEVVNRASAVGLEVSAPDVDLLMREAHEAHQKAMAAFA